MPRTNRCLEPGAIFHVFNRGVERREIFLDERDRIRFLGLLQRSSRLFDCAVVAYCLMGNHFHLVLRDSRGHLPAVMQRLSLRYALGFNLKYDRDGPLFRGRFKSVRILNEEALNHVIEYVHQNPSKDGFVDDPRCWVWSSYKYYEGLAPFPDWITPSSSLWNVSHGFGPISKDGLILSDSGGLHSHPVSMV